MKISMEVDKDTFAGDPAAFTIEKLCTMIEEANENTIKSSQAATALIRIMQQEITELRQEKAAAEAANISISTTCTELQDQVTTLEKRRA